MTMISDSESAEAFTESVRRMLPVAWNLRDTDRVGREPSDFLEDRYDVVCVALPDLCLDAVCRYIITQTGALPSSLQMMADSAGTAGGRPVRGACIAWRGVGMLLVDERDAPDEQRFSLMHEGSHFLLDYHIPRQDALRSLGSSIRDVLDGRRLPNFGERFYAVLRGKQLQWHTHLYDRRAAHRSQAEADADALACLLLAPPLNPDSLIGMSDAALATLTVEAGLPDGVAVAFLHALKNLAQPPQRHRNPLLSRLTG